MSNQIPFLEIGGSSYEQGFRHGREFKEKIPILVENHFRHLESRSKANSISVSKKDSLALAGKHLPYAKQYSSQLIDEIHGIAEGSELSFEDVFCLNCFLDLYDISVPSLGLLFGCTCFALSTQATGNQAIFVGQGYDTPSVYQIGAVVLKIKPDHGPTKLVFKIAGMVGCAGLNSYGIGLAINKLFPKDSRPGVPYTFIVRDVLDQIKIGDALGSILRPKRASGINYVLAEKNGELYCVETTASEYDIIYGFDGFLCHANHYLTEKMKTWDITTVLTYNSIVRFSRMQRLVRDKFGTIGIDDLEAFLKDHVNYPLSICRHEDPSFNEYVVGKTISSFVFDPLNLVARVSLGNPCENGFTEFRI
jgi:isopenicillin-N N-acyltransferase-like protein